MSLLVNLHLTAAIPGWALSEAALARHLERNDSEPITDPWVAERATLCAMEGYRVLAVAHRLRYGVQPEVGDACRGTAEIGWFLARPGRSSAPATLLAAADEQFHAWGIGQTRGWGSGLPAGPLWGVPDVWPHVADALLAAGYRPDPAMHREALYGGWLPTVPPSGGIPVAGLTIRRRVGTFETRLAAKVEVQEGWRNRGIGTWLVRHAAAWLRLAGCDRVVLAVAEENEAAGAGRFYQCFGWEVLTREIHGWMRIAQSGAPGQNRASLIPATEEQTR